MTNENVESESGIWRKSAHLRSPNSSRSSSSSDMRSRSSSLSKSDRRLATEMRMDFMVFPAPSLNLRYMRHGYALGCGSSAGSRTKSPASSLHASPVSYLRNMWSSGYM